MTQIKEIGMSKIEGAEAIRNTLREASKITIFLIKVKTWPDEITGVVVGSNVEKSDGYNGIVSFMFNTGSVDNPTRVKIKLLDIEYIKQSME